MKFCSHCGSDRLEFRIPEDDNRERRVCADCGTIHYVNPKIVAGALLSWESRVLLAKRDIEPRRGYWTLPAGYMELGESVAAAAARECWEEARAEPVDLELYGIFSLPQISQVYIMYRGELKDGAYGVGEESSDARLWLEEEIPWDDLAFPIVHRTLKRWLEERKTGEYTVFEQVLERRPR